MVRVAYLVLSYSQMKAHILTTTFIAMATACTTSQPFKYEVERFADIEILRYEVPGFETLPPQQKELIYYLSEAALCGRDILFDQNGRNNLAIRRTLEAIQLHYPGDRATDAFQHIDTYTKRIWFANGIHHHYAQEKFVPAFTPAELKSILLEVEPTHLPLPLADIEAQLFPLIFDASIAPKKVNQTPGSDLILSSANNYYGDGVTQAEVEAFYGAMREQGGDEPASFGLNSTLVKRDGQLVEDVWRVGGKYSPAIEKIVYWLERANAVAENEAQSKVITTLIDYYRTGNLRTFDEYAIAWLDDLASHVDFVNGFTETYGDALGLKASWEGIVNFKNLEATKRAEVLGVNAQWFEDHSPTDDRFKKKNVKGISAKVITVATLGGDCYPATPIGINLPNSAWIRREHGSKSVTIENITEAYDKSSQHGGFNEEFVWSDDERELIAKYGFATSNLDVDMHECLGHGSGQLLPGVSPDALGSYGATMEEARADIYALYFLGDPKLIELGLLPDEDAHKAEYYRFMMNGLMTQLVRIDLGKEVEESHMRNRQLIARWVYDKGGKEVVEIVKRKGESYVVIHDYKQMRTLFGQLLGEIQRIKSEGDFAAARDLVEDYGVKVDYVLHQEILERYKSLNLAPYKGFVNPVMRPVMDGDKIVDVELDYTEGYREQMLRYSRDYSFLPTVNP